MAKFDWELGTNPVRDGWLIVYSAHMYYQGTRDEQSPLTDEEFDALKYVVLINWSQLDKRVQSILMSPEDAKTSTFYINLSKVDKYIAERAIF